MCTHEKLFWLLRKWHKMRYWEKNFLLEQTYHMFGTSEANKWLHDESLRDYLSDVKIAKIKELYEKHKEEETQETAKADTHQETSEES